MSDKKPHKHDAEIDRLTSLEKEMRRAANAAGTNRKQLEIARANELFGYPIGTRFTCAQRGHRGPKTLTVEYTGHNYNRYSWKGPNIGFLMVKKDGTTGVKGAGYVDMDTLKPVEETNE